VSQLFTAVLEEVCRSVKSNLGDLTKAHTRKLIHIHERSTNHRASHFFPRPLAVAVSAGSAQPEYQLVGCLSTQRAGGLGSRVVKYRIMVSGGQVSDSGAALVFNEISSSVWKENPISVGFLFINSSLRIPLFKLYDHKQASHKHHISVSEVGRQVSDSEYRRLQAVYDHKQASTSIIFLVSEVGRQVSGGQVSDSGAALVFNEISSSVWKENPISVGFLFINSSLRIPPSSSCIRPQASYFWYLKLEDR
ncbi:hypothetical protein TNIN_106121, partial [Trichonephila inaurata madagascariensis]